MRMKSQMLLLCKWTGLAVTLLCSNLGSTASLLCDLTKSHNSAGLQFPQW